VIISRVTVGISLLILLSTILDVASTNLGVVILGNGEASPIASYVIRTFGSSWWVFYFPYEFGALLLAFFVLRTTRLRLFRRFLKYNILSILKVEYLVIFVSYATVVNNAILLLIRTGRL